ncbi:MAG: DUF2589 domain-containing protein [Methanothrix sp.]|jgi:hypothetical protein|nr:DUF2589 domain-containing protein [Methanothrix sp.]
MPVSGREIATLDFANLIGGPLNAVVEAQAKSAITTANFIKEVGFTKEGKVINVDFTYNRKNDDGEDQQFTLTVPFLTMLPVPYISIVDAVIEFNAKITSINESHMEDNFSQQLDVEAGGKLWFITAKVQSKTAYQKKSATSEREERTFDMHVRVEAKNQDMPSGTERILTLLENSIGEKKGPLLAFFKIVSKDATDKKILNVESENIDKLKSQKFSVMEGKNSHDFTINNSDAEKGQITLNEEINDSYIGKSFELPLKPVTKSGQGS